MKLDNDNVRKTLETAKTMLAEEKNISPALLAVLNLLIMFMQVMLGKFGLNSNNSSNHHRQILTERKAQIRKIPPNESLAAKKGVLGNN